MLILYYFCINTLRYMKENNEGYDVLKLKEVMREQSITAKELAAKADINPVYISQIVTGKKLPSMDKLLLIAKMLQVDVRDLFKPTKKIGKGSLEAMKQARAILDQAIKDAEHGE